MRRKSRREVRAIIEAYFAGHVWAFEKQEWAEMSETEREQLVEALYTFANREESREQLAEPGKA